MADGTPRQEQIAKIGARAALIALLLVFHAALFVVLNPRFSVPVELPAHELVLILPQRTPKPVTLPGPVFPNLVIPSAPVIGAPLLPPAPEFETPSQPNITGLGQSLFGCDLANSRNLPPDQRENCLQAALPPSAPEIGMPKKSRAVERARWEAELAARRTPPAVPCTHLERTVIGGFGAQKPVTTIMPDMLCLLNGLLNGFGPAK